MAATPFASDSKIGVILSKLSKIVRTSKPLLQVINAGQNGICSWTILHERIPFVIACKPDFVTILIGYNDVRGVYRADWAIELLKGFAHYLFGLSWNDFSKCIRNKASRLTVC
jgi:hypothetical protein